MNQCEQVAVDSLSSLSLQLPANACSSPVNFFYPEDGGDMFFRNVG
jgi:hypothetical protein